MIDKLKKFFKSLDKKDVIAFLVLFFLLWDLSAILYRRAKFDIGYNAFNKHMAELGKLSTIETKIDNVLNIELQNLKDRIYRLEVYVYGRNSNMFILQNGTESINIEKKLR